MSDPQTEPESAANGEQAPELFDLANLELLKTKAAERDQYLDLLQRNRAEFENYQKRNQREREQERKYVLTPLLFDFLPILDNLDRATEAAKKAGEKGPLVDGVGLVTQQFLDLLKRYNVTRIDALGKPFDPNLHQALVQQPTAEKPPETVLQVIEPGYQIHDRVLRPAKVIVAAAPK